MFMKSFGKKFGNARRQNAKGPSQIEIPSEYLIKIAIHKLDYETEMAINDRCHVHYSTAIH